MGDNKHTARSLGILKLHASAVSVNGGALIFLGPSGVGKSTICQLLAGFAQPLADDITHLVPQGRGRWTVVDASDRSGLLSESEAMARKRIPLQATFRLYQASQPRLERVEPLESCRHLTAALFENRIWAQYETWEEKAVFSELAAIARSVPGYRFYFDQSPKTIEMIAAEANVW
jgi:energy-coupling factor transporter ATP-binding protein EcfA2